MYQVYNIALVADSEIEINKTILSPTNALQKFIP